MSAEGLLDTRDPKVTSGQAIVTPFCSVCAIVKQGKLRCRHNVDKYVVE